MNKQQKVTTIEQADNAFSILFKQGQDKEFTFLTFEGAGIWPDSSLIPEKGLVICENTTDNAERLYTKIKGNLKYLSFT